MHLGSAFQLKVEAHFGCIKIILVVWGQHYQKIQWNKIENKPGCMTICLYTELKNMGPSRVREFRIPLTFSYLRIYPKHLSLYCVVVPVKPIGSTPSVESPDFPS